MFSGKPGGFHITKRQVVNDLSFLYAINFYYNVSLNDTGESVPLYQEYIRHL